MKRIRVPLVVQNLLRRMSGRAPRDLRVDDRHVAYPIIVNGVCVGGVAFRAPAKGKV